ncbi:Fc.00g014530.m01.CDS01 [Cosmosporella sp. VM-42]
MARGGRGGGQQQPRRPVDLTGVITAAERNDLATLVNAITEKIHNGISSIFDSPPVTPVQIEHGHHHWLSLSLMHRKENRPSSLPSQNNKSGQPSKTYAKTHQIIEKEEKEAMTPQLRELKKEALVFFRKWQTNVLQRIRDVNVNDPNSPQGSFRGRGRGFRGARGARGGRGGRGGGRGGLTLATGPPRAPSNHLDRDLARRFTPIPNPLWTLPLEKRKLLLHTVLLLLLSLGEYSANARILLLNLTSSLNLPIKALHDEESRLAQGLSQVAIEFAPELVVDQKSDENKAPRKAKFGLGGCIHPNSAVNLALPLSAVGIGTSHGGYGLSSFAAVGLLGAMAENGAVASSLFGIYQTKPTSKMIDTFAREIQDFGLLPLHCDSITEYTDAKEMISKDRRLRMVFAMNGWLTDKDEVMRPWRFIGSQAEVYAVRWEMNTLLNLGSSLETVLKSSAWSVAKEEIISRTIFTSLIEATWPSALLKVSKIIDNPWSIGMVRAEKAGAVLADAIMRNKVQGDRPVSLIGYSLAARAIYACLMVLAERRQFGIVESVVMMGTPAPSESRVWLTLKSVVSGRLINVYSESDYLLGFLYRTSNIHFGVAGLQEIQGADGVENHDVSDLVSGHLRYSSLTGKILKDIGWEDLDAEAYKADKKK